MTLPDRGAQRVVARVEDQLGVQHRAGKQARLQRLSGRGEVEQQRVSRARLAPQPRALYAELLLFICELTRHEPAVTEAGVGGQLLFFDSPADAGAHIRLDGLRQSVEPLECFDE